MKAVKKGAVIPCDVARRHEEEVRGARQRENDIKRDRYKDRPAFTVVAPERAEATRRRCVECGQEVSAKRAARGLDTCVSCYRKHVGRLSAFKAMIEEDRLVNRRRVEHEARMRRQENRRPVKTVAEVVAEAAKEQPKRLCRCGAPLAPFQDLCVVCASYERNEAALAAAAERKGLTLDQYKEWLKLPKEKRAEFLKAVYAERQVETDFSGGCAQ